MNPTRKRGVLRRARNRVAAIAAVDIVARHEHQSLRRLAPSIAAWCWTAIRQSLSRRFHWRRARVKIPTKKINSHSKNSQKTRLDCHGMKLIARPLNPERSAEGPAKPV